MPYHMAHAFPIAFLRKRTLHQTALWITLLTNSAKEKGFNQSCYKKHIDLRLLVFGFGWMNNL